MNRFFKTLPLVITHISLGAFLFTSLCWQPKVQAQMRVWPMILKAEAKRGRAQGVISVGNQGERPIRARVYAEPFTYNDQGFQTLESEARDLTPYLQFSPKELVILPGKTRKIRVSSLFPPSLPEAEYRAAIFTERLEESSTTSGDDTNNLAFKVTFKVRIAVVFFVYQGNLTPNLSVKEASWNAQQKQIQILVSNTGKASVYPSVNWTLKQGENIVATSELPRQGIITETERHFLLNYPSKEESITPGEYQLVGELLWGDPNAPEKAAFNVNVTIPTDSGKSL